MNLFTKAWRKLTYRNEYTNPDPEDSLHITSGRWGARIVRDPQLAPALHARRMRMVQAGLDQVDLEAYMASAPMRMAIVKAVADELAARATPVELVRR